MMGCVKPSGTRGMPVPGTSSNGSGSDGNADRDEQCSGVRTEKKHCTHTSQTGKGAGSMRHCRSECPRRTCSGSMAFTYPCCLYDQASGEIEIADALLLRRKCPISTRTADSSTLSLQPHICALSHSPLWVAKSITLDEELKRLRRSCATFTVSGSTCHCQFTSSSLSAVATSRAITTSAESSSDVAEVSSVFCCRWPR